MLLRRITEHVKAQNWTAVALDFFIVVVGVFIGIQVSNWNEARVENALADTFLVRLHEDISKDEAALKNRVEFWKEVIDYGADAINYIESGDLGDNSEWELLIAFYQASQLWKYEASDPTFEELKGGGQLGLIKNNALRTDLVGYYEDLDRRAADLYTLNPEYRRIIRAKTPYSIQTHIWENCHTGDGVDQELLDCGLPDAELDVLSILEDFAEDPRVIESLRFWIVNLSITRDQGILERERLRVLAGKIKKAQE
ncbi:MAG: hypothetical protein DHS20C05_21620 [Hyphococcus sp.]|nr:MAG: hypothetical protein DHS20C05_21620 [Marinicaulis sp.]